MNILGIKQISHKKMVNVPDTVLEHLNIRVGESIVYVQCEEGVVIKKVDKEKLCEII